MYLALQRCFMALVYCHIPVPIRHYRPMFRFALLLCLLTCSAVPDTARAQGREVREVPLVLLQGPVALVPPIKAALSEFVGRQGGIWVDLSTSTHTKGGAADLDLQKAIAAYQQFDYPKALEHLDAGLLEVHVNGAQGITTSQLSDLFLYRGLVRSAQSDTQTSWDDFVQAAVIEPTRHLDAARFPPSVAAQFERAREQVEKSPRSTMQIQVSTSCEVYLDARMVVHSEVVPLPVGNHFLRVTCPGKIPYGSLVSLQRETEVIAPKLKRPQFLSPEELSSVARRRGFGHFVWVHADSGDVAGAIAVFELWKTDGKKLRVTRLTLQGGEADRLGTLAAMKGLQQYWAPAPQGIRPPARIVRSTPWYRNPWLWAAGGALVTSSVLVPLLLNDGAKEGFDVSIGGARP